MHPDLSHLAEIDHWRAGRLAALTAEDGWLNLTDRVEIAPGSHQVGSAPDNDVVLGVGPAFLGTLTLNADGTGSLLTPDGVTHPFAPVPEAPPRLRIAPLLLELHNVDGAVALRVRDMNSPARLTFAGLRYFPVDPAWIIRAEWRALDAPQRLGIDMAGGMHSAVELTHSAHFTHAGQSVSLLATHWKAGKPMFVFRDATAGRETYGAGRFLIGEEVTAGAITLDFNKAYNPPCSFTDLAICPLPPAQNILRFRIEAGELAP